MSEDTDSTANAFYTPKWFAVEVEKRAIPPRGRLLIAGCCSECLSDTLARTINRIHYDRSVSEVFYRPKGSGLAVAGNYNRGGAAGC